MVRNRELKRDLDELRHQIELIRTVVMVSNPDSIMAADAYEGLRKTILRSLSATQALHAALADLDKVASSTTDIEFIRVKLSELLAQYGIQKVTRYEDRPNAFEPIGPGPRFSVTKPAYVTESHLPPVVMGVAETTDEPPPHPATLTTGPKVAGTDEAGSGDGSTAADSPKPEPRDLGRDGGET